MKVITATPDNVWYPAHVVSEQASEIARLRAENKHLYAILAELTIDFSPLTEDDIKWAQKLIEKHGW